MEDADMGVPALLAMFLEVVSLAFFSDPLSVLDTVDGEAPLDYSMNAPEFVGVPASLNVYPTKASRLTFGENFAP